MRACAIKKTMPASWNSLENDIRKLSPLEIYFRAIASIGRNSWLVNWKILCWRLEWYARNRGEIRRTNCKEKLLRVVRHGNICFKPGWTSLGYRFNWCRCVRRHKEILTQDMLQDQPNFVGAEIMILRTTSFSNQFQNRLRFLMGESRCEGLGMAMDPHRRAITMLHIKEWFLLKSPLRKNIVSKSLKEKFKSCWIKISSLKFPLKTKTMMSLSGWPNNASSTSVRYLSEGSKRKVA